MGLEAVTADVVNQGSHSAEGSTDGSQQSKCNKRRVPKRVHKSEREKMKREHLNELFLALANALGLPQENNGKASLLGETTKLLKEMRTLIENLRTENTALLSESHYVSVEKNELQDENSMLEDQIGKLQVELRERLMQSKPDLNVPPTEEPTLQFPPNPVLQQAMFSNPVIVFPVCPDVKAYADHDATSRAEIMHTSNVSKPQARYPTPDSWPPQLIVKHPELFEQCRDNGAVI